MKRIILLILAFSLLFSVCAEEEGEAFAAGPVSLYPGTGIFSDEARTQSVGLIEQKLVAFAVLLITGEDGRQALEILYWYEGELRTGYVKPVNASFLSESELENYLNETTEPDGFYGELPLLSAVFKPKEPEEPEEPDEPDEPDHPKRVRQVRITGEERGKPGAFTHVRGDWTMAYYWGTGTDTCETESGVLLLSGTEIGVSGTDLTAVVEDDTLTLRGTDICVSGQALLTLRESGITRVIANEITLPTESFLSGGVYASLRSQGIGDRKIDYEIIGGTVIAGVLGDSYVLTQNAENGAWELERSGV